MRAEWEMEDDGVGSGTCLHPLSFAESILSFVRFRGVGQYHETSAESKSALRAASPPTLAKARGWGTHSFGCAPEIKSLGHPPQ
jgi:hypothetical protein